MSALIAWMLFSAARGLVKGGAKRRRFWRSKTLDETAARGKGTCQAIKAGSLAVSHLSDPGQ